MIGLPGEERTRQPARARTCAAYVAFALTNSMRRRTRSGLRRTLSTRISTAVDNRSEPFCRSPAAVAFQPVHTAFSDIFGRKAALYLCCLLFSAGLIVFGLARSPAAVIAGRTIQGMGGGGLEALSEVVLTDLTTLKERPLYLGIISFVWAAASVIGPPVGGTLAQYLSWRWLARINLPLMGISMLLIPPFLTLHQDRSSMRSKLRRVDWRGILLFITASTLILFSLTSGGQMFPWRSYQTLLPLAIGTLSLGLFCLAERRASSPMIPPRVLNTVMLAATMLATFLHGMAMWCLLYYAPIYFQSVFGHPPLASAIGGFSFGFTATPAAIIAAFLIHAAHRYLWSIALGLVCATAGIAIMTLLSIDTGVVAGRTLLVLAGLGLGMLYPALTMPVQVSVGADLVGVATGTLVFFRALGMAVGVAVGSAIFTNEFAAGLRRSRLDAEGFGFEGASEAFGFIPRIQGMHVAEADRRALLKVYAASFRAICVAVAVVAGIGLLTTVLIKDVSLESEEQGRQAFQDEI